MCNFLNASHFYPIRRSYPPPMRLKVEFVALLALWLLSLAMALSYLFG